MASPYIQHNARVHGDGKILYDFKEATNLMMRTRIVVLLEKFHLHLHFIFCDDKISTKGNDTSGCCLLLLGAC